MLKNALITLAASLVLGGVALAQTETQDCATAEACVECPTVKKVNALLTSWQSAKEQAMAATPEQRAAFAAKAAGVAATCPVGSRLGETVDTVRDVLGFVMASSEACAGDCPLESAEGCAEAKAMKAGRSMALGKLHQLASYTADMTGCATAGAACSTVREAGCEGTAKTECSDAASSTCPIRLASRLGALKASFVTARQEAKALTPDARRALLTGLTQLGEQSQAVTLVPASVQALAEGLDALTQLHAKMAEWGQANPELMAKMSESTKRSFMMEVALIDEARGLLAGVTETMALVQQPEAKAAAVSLPAGR
jgi:hypothetical protein